MSPVEGVIVNPAELMAAVALDTELIDFILANPPDSPTPSPWIRLTSFIMPDARLSNFCHN